MLNQLRQGAPFVVCFAGWLPLLSGQGLDRQTQSAPADLLGQFVCLERSEGNVVAVGRDYKATFTATGVEFTPALGAAVPTNLPLAWRLRDIRRGDVVYHEAIATAAEGQEREVVYTRGDIEERYVVRHDGLKQSFVFHRVVSGRGDLVVSCTLATALQASPQLDGSLAFVGPTGSGVHVGRVLVFDALGKPCDGALRLVGDTLEMVVPGTFVDQAAWPLTLDPLIGTTLLLNGAQVISPFDCDVTYADGTGTAERFLVVFSVAYSSVDSDILAVRVSGDGSLTNLIIDGGTTRFSTRPRAGYVRASGRYLIVWQDSAAPPLFDIRCVALSGVSGAPSAAVTLANAAGNEFNVAVAGDSTLTADDALVAWESDAGIHLRQVAVFSSGVPSPSTAVLFVSGLNVNTPALSKSADANNRLILAWQAPGPIAEDIFVQLLTRDMVRVGPVLSLGGGSVIVDREPAVDGSMVVWSRESSAFPSATFDLYGAFLDQSASGLTVRAGPRALATSSTRDEGAADVVRLGRRHCVVYSSVDSSGRGPAYALTLNDDCTTCNARMAINTIAGSEQFSYRPRITSYLASRSDGDRGLIACSTWPATGRPVLNAQYVQDLGPGIPPITLGGACGDTLQFQPDPSPFVIGNTTFQFRALPSVAMSVFVSIGLSGTAFPCGTCVLTNPILTIPGAQLGSAYAEFPVPCSASYIGVALEAQWVGVGLNPPGACPAVPLLSASTRRTYVLSQ